MRTSHSPREIGFTLLEVLIAMMLLAVALVMLSNSWSAAFARLDKTQISFMLASRLEMKMNELERKYKGKPLTEIQEEESGDFEDGTSEYTWKMASRKFTFPDIASSLSARDGGVDTMTMTIVKQMTDQISKSVKEVTVTVIYTNKKKKKLEASATTYFIDYDKGLNLGIPGGP